MSVSLSIFKEKEKKIEIEKKIVLDTLNITQYLTIT